VGNKHSYVHKGSLKRKGREMKLLHGVSS